ncbi:MAG: selenocysteine-specific translation elongation factor [Clostridiales bacterium]|jgi:selenocysteine-specific elongation factor|nr:selenocysteine-specific translation elongation factor [Clostridiales bacterium]
MKHVVMGTAGHIDHGKTALVKRLTGVDTDRLEEEKRRGMTIELGFAPLTLPSGNIISIIDVPGHEKFVKTMVAGVTGIDFVMLVIAADEGVMPQTREHIDILSLLNIKAGVVVLTKSDLVDSDWLEMVKEDIKKVLSDTTLAQMPIIPVSSIIGSGIDKLVNTLEELTADAAKANVAELFRLPVDRVFTMKGYGTVVTGTIHGGEVSKGDTVEVVPSALTARVRGIQVHNCSVESAGAGERCALNLSGIEKDDINKGDTITAKDIIMPSKVVDAVLYTVKGKEGISHNQRVHLHTGTKEVLARIRVIGTDEIPEGSKGYVQIRFEEPVAILRGDRYIIRSYSPVRTLGGGSVLFQSPKNRQRFSQESIEAFTIGEKGSLKEIISYIIESSGKVFSVEDIWKELFANRNEIQKALAEEIDSGNLLFLKETGKYLGRALYNEYINKINTEFSNLYKRYPYRFKIDREEIKSQVFHELDIKDFSAVLTRLAEDNQFELKGNYILQANQYAIKKIFAMKITSILEKEILEDGLNIRKAQQLSKDLGIEVNDVQEIEKFFIQTDKIVDLDNGILMHSEVLKRTINIIRSILDNQGSATASQIRDSLGISRKTAIALLEFTDSREITQRVEDTRKPGVHYMDYYI